MRQPVGQDDKQVEVAVLPGIAARPTSEQPNGPGLQDGNKSVAQERDGCGLISKRTYSSSARMVEQVSQRGFAATPQQFRHALQYLPVLGQSSDRLNWKTHFQASS